MRAFKNREPFEYDMGLSMRAINRLLSVTLLATLIVAFTTRDAIQTAWTAIALCGLIGFVWIISTKDTTFEYLGLNNKGLLNAFAFIVTIILFSQFCISLWDSPFVGTYILSLATIGTFWWTIDVLQPATV
ncbi:MAG: hypothetical protein DWB99_07095 [Candidatus Poseidoniales archaeon]|nr:MAG: hypothetical protein DWB99_07095 [Candidatus Poseidoniales archaeon]|tara:strand:+ start:1359 stop:1751 length:393 start_codon:yes stop_codon:yes gene_type:complete